MRVKISPNGATKDVDITEVTAENYIVPDNERHLYHYLQEIPHHDSKTGRRLSRPRLQKAGAKVFKTILSNTLRRHGYAVTVLYDPTQYIMELGDKVGNAQEAKIASAVNAALLKQADEYEARIDAKFAYLTSQHERELKERLESQAQEYEARIAKMQAEAPAEAAPQTVAATGRRKTAAKAEAPAPEAEAPTPAPEAEAPTAGSSEAPAEAPAATAE